MILAIGVGDFIITIASLHILTVVLNFLITRPFFMT